MTGRRLPARRLQRLRWHCLYDSWPLGSPSISHPSRTLHPFDSLGPRGPGLAGGHNLWFVAWLVGHLMLGGPSDQMAPTRDAVFYSEPAGYESQQPDRLMPCGSTDPTFTIFSRASSSLSAPADKSNSRLLTAAQDLETLRPSSLSSKAISGRQSRVGLLLILVKRRPSGAKESTIFWSSG